MSNFFGTRKIKDINALFASHYVDPKAMYAMLFDKVPCVMFISETDGTKVYDHIQKKLRHQLVKLYQHNYHDYDKNELLFNNSVFVLTNDRIIEVTGSYVHVLHTPSQYNWAGGLIKELAEYRIKPAPTEDKRVIGFARSNAMN